MADHITRPEASRPDGVKPCPAHSAHSCEVRLWQSDACALAEPWQVVADCGTAGPHGDTREEAVEAWNALPRRPVLRPFADWHEDHGCCLWWRQPIEEPPWAGSPLDSDWPWDEDDEPKMVWITCPEELAWIACQGTETDRLEEIADGE